MTWELRRRRWVAHALLGLAVLLCATLMVFPPERFDMYPGCPVWTYLHMRCPGCGATRALAALLDGRWREAWQWNQMFVLLLPFGLVGAAESYRRAVVAGPFRWPEVPRPALFVVLGTAAVFMAGRNL